MFSQNMQGARRGSLLVALVAAQLLPPPWPTHQLAMKRSQVSLHDKDIHEEDADRFMAVDSWGRQQAVPAWQLL